MKKDDDGKARDEHKMRDFAILTLDKNFQPLGKRVDGSVSHMEHL
jgi:hypothetical protein